MCVIPSESSVQTGGVVRCGSRWRLEMVATSDLCGHFAVHTVTFCLVESRFLSFIRMI